LGRGAGSGAAVEVDLGFEHPGERCWDGGDAAAVGVTVVGFRPLEDLALVGGAADLEGLAVEVFAAQGQRESAEVSERLSSDPLGPFTMVRVFTDCGLRLGDPCGKRNQMALKTLRRAECGAATRVKAYAPDGSRTRDLRLERPTLFGPPKGPVDH
jgi:hypothetical protein